MTVRFVIAAALMLGLPTISLAQTGEIVAAPSPDADALAADMRLLAENPEDLATLIDAGERATRLGDTAAAAALFTRAERIAPQNTHLQAANAALMVRNERPGEALRAFAQAEANGQDLTPYLADRGLAYDLIGDQARAQRDYRDALKHRANDETTRRYALSLAISGKRDQALDLLDPLVRRSDRGGWRVRSFVLAITGDQAGARQIATSMLPPTMATGLDHFFATLPALPPADRAFAVHFGELRASPERLADARLAPRLAPLPPEPVAAAPTALVAVPAHTDKSRRGRKAVPPAIVPVSKAVVADARPPLPAPPKAELVVEPPVAQLAIVPEALTRVPLKSGTPEKRRASERPSEAVSDDAPRIIAPLLAKAMPTAKRDPASLADASPKSPARASEGLDRTATASGAAGARRPATPDRLLPDRPAPDRPASARPARPNDLALDDIVAGITTSTSAVPDKSVSAPRASSDRRDNDRMAAPDSAKPLKPDQPKPDKATKEKVADATAGAGKDKAAADLIDCPPVPTGKAVKGGVTPKAAKGRKASTPVAKCVTGKGAETKAGKKAKPDPAKADPARIWVQVAGGANERDLAKAWAAVKAKAPAAFKGRTGWSVPLRATNRVLTGPFKTSGEAQAFVNMIAKSGVSAFVFNSEGGQKIDKLGAQ